MNKIVILDTWIKATNTGNKVIMDAVLRELRDIFPNSFFYQVPALEFLHESRSMVNNGDYVFLGGANLLSSTMNNPRNGGWRLRPRDMLWLRNVILFGLGWWKYQPFPPNLYTRTLLNMVLKKDCYHEVRDSYTLNRLKNLGFNVLNAGCPSIWRLTPEHCRDIPREKADIALITFTSYRQSVEEDMALFDIVRKNYSKIYFWPQDYRDYLYAKNICKNSDVIFVDPSIEALDDLLRTESLDHVGTRLHGGIRALQHKRRTIIIAVDNRASEMGKDFNLPVIQRDDIRLHLENRINGTWNADVKIDQTAIGIWKNQFTPASCLDFSNRHQLSTPRYIYKQIVPERIRMSLRNRINKAIS